MYSKTRDTDAVQVGPQSLIFSDPNAVLAGQESKEFWIENTLRSYDVAYAIYGETDPEDMAFPFELSPHVGVMERGKRLTVTVRPRKASEIPPDVNTAWLEIRWALVFGRPFDTAGSKAELNKRIKDYMVKKGYPERRITLHFLRPVAKNRDVWLSLKHWTEFTLRNPDGSFASARFRPLNLCPVGRGGFADVYRCELEVEDEPSNRTIAVKQIRNPYSSDSSEQIAQRIRGRVMKELMAWAKLRHENVLPMLGHLTVPDVLFFSEWSDNGHVLRYVKATKATREDRLRLMRECASGLLYLHENSVIHGDLRHDNILVTNDGRAAISDFGLSKLVEGNSPRSVTVDVTTSIECKGSKFYMAPELLVTKDHPKPKRSMAVDVYAFGILIIEIGGAKEAFGERVHRWYIRMEEYVAGDMNPSPEIFPDLQNRGPLWELSRACMVFMPIERLDMEHCEAALSGLGERLHEVFTSKVRVAETE